MSIRGYTGNMEPILILLGRNLFLSIFLKIKSWFEGEKWQRNGQVSMGNLLMEVIFQKLTYTITLMDISMV